MVLADNWQTPTGATWTQGNVNGDGYVNATDASILAANWGYGTSEATASVPEPCLGWLCLTAGLLLLLAARREHGPH